jgi:hypothetical protein
LKAPIPKATTEIAARRTFAISGRQAAGKPVYALRATPGRQKNGTLEPLAHEQVVVQLAKKLHALKLSSRLIAQELNAHNYRNRAGGLFVKTQVQRILSR